MRIFRRDFSTAQIVSAATILIVLVSSIILARMQYTREYAALEAALTQASFTASENLRNPAIFTHEDTDRIASLQESVAMLAGIEKRIMESKVYLIRSERESALQYMDYLNRLARKLNEVSDSEASAKASVDEYQNSLSLLKSSNAAQRTATLQEMERDRTVARYATDLSYQECVLLRSLMEQYPQIYTLSQATLDGDLLINPSSWKTFEAALGEEIKRRQKRRGEFNPAMN